MKLNRIFKYISLFAPIPEGYAVGLAIHNELHWDPWIVLIAAGIVAFTGFYAIQIANEMSEFNATLFGDEKKQKMGAPTWKAGVVVAVWFVGVILLTVFLKSVPVLKDWTPVALVVVGGSSAYLFSLSNVLEGKRQERDEYRVTKDHKKEEERKQRESDKKERQEREQQLAMKRQELSARMQSAGTVAREKTGAKLTREMLLLEWAGNPFLTPSDMARVLWNDGAGIRVSRQAIKQRLDKMVKEGLVVIEPDGRVVEVVQVVSSGAGEG